MSGNYWRGIPADRLPASVARAQLTHLHAAIDSERERVQVARVQVARATLADTGAPDREDVSQGASSTATHAPAQCPVCEGTGEVSEWVPYGMGDVAMPVPCDCACHGEPEDADGAA